MLFITGPHAAGKTMTAAILARHGFVSIDLGPTLRDCYKCSGYQGTFLEWIAAGERRMGRHFTDKVIVREVRKFLSTTAKRALVPDVVIVGSRSIAGINHLIRNLNSCVPGPHRIVYIDAPRQILFARYRRREGRNIPHSEFHKLLKADRDLGVNEIRAKADRRILNNGSFYKLQRLVKSLVASWYPNHGLNVVRGKGGRRAN